MLLLQALRILTEVSLYALARRTGISPSRLSLFERDLVVPPPEDRRKMARSLQTKAAVLFMPATTRAFVEHALEDEGL